MKILIVSVGGSCAPVVTSILSNKPDRVYFICSDDDRISGNKGSYITVIGEGKICGNDLKNPDKLNIVKQSGLDNESFEIIKIQDFDDHNKCYLESINLIQKIKKDYPGSEIVADYTGGTKSMTVGLVMAAADVPEIIIASIVGGRTNLIKVDDGTQRINLIRVNYSFLEKQKQIAEHFISKYDYSSASTVLQNVFQTNYDLPTELRHEFQILFSVCQAFESWDRFDHLEALNKLKTLRKFYWKYINALEKIIKSRDFIEKRAEIGSKVTGFEVVEDLILNAQRRAHQQRYDDAVARIYRATELLAQVYLFRNYNLETGNIDLEKLPEQLRKKYSLRKDDSGKVRLGLMDSFHLIAELDSKQVGPIFISVQKKLLSSLEKRNGSILAHGFTPVMETDYKMAFDALVTSFIKPVINVLEGQKKQEELQFPTSVQLFQA